MKAWSCVGSVRHGSLDKVEPASAHALRPKRYSAHFRRHVANVLASAITIFTTIEAGRSTETQFATTENIRPAASEATRSGQVASEIDPPDGSAAVVYGQISNQLRQLANDQNIVTGTSNPLSNCEIVIEAAYRLQRCPGWTPQPCVEYIIHSGDSTAIHNALVTGIRSHLTLWNWALKSTKRTS